MPPQDDAEERTEDATPRKREREREEGRVPSSREVGTLFVLTAATLSLYYLGAGMTARTRSLFVYFFENLGSLELTREGAVRLMTTAFLHALAIIGPFMLALVLASISGYLIQVGFMISPKPLQPRPSRLNPLEGAKRIFSSHMLAETLKSILKFAVILTVSWQVLDSVIANSNAWIDRDPDQLIDHLLSVGLKLALIMLVFLAAEALLDYSFQRWQFEKGIRMSRYEIKQELKETEGDPQIKARVRAIRQQQARQRMMKEVPRAEVVITNPTHYSVALRYDPREREAPHVVAKGSGLIALRIREIAQEHGVPLYEDRWLARQLYRTCDIGDTAPVELWQAVAKVLAFVRALDRKKVAAGL